MIRMFLLFVSLVGLSAVMLLAPAISSAEPANQSFDDCSNLVTTPFPSQGSTPPGEFWNEFSRPLPATPAWNAPGTKRVGLQAGHWKVEEAPYELRRLSAGTSG